MIGSFLEQQQQSCNAALARVAVSLPRQGRLAEALRYAIDGGGKRLRPALCAASYEAVARRKASESIADLGCAVELIHTYSLVHDDLPCMDDDDVRRGRPTTHRVFGDEVAVVTGAALIPLAFQVAAGAIRDLGLPSAAATATAASLAQGAGAGGMVGGQVLDLEGESAGVDLDRLEQTHAAKTGALLRSACRIGAIAGGASERQLAAIDEFGRHLGLAFQITDDVLDETATSEQLGKTAGKDREVAKATYPALLGVEGAVERAASEARAAIEALRGTDLASDVLAALCRFAVERKR
ncbi:MAG TPA: farnesyl diphosphate synthase [Longimicrobiales bacterium]